MKKQLAYEICLIMSPHLSASQTHLLEKTLIQVFTHFGIPETTTSNSQDTYESNEYSVPWIPPIHTMIPVIHHSDSVF